MEASVRSMAPVCLDVITVIIAGIWQEVEKWHQDVGQSVVVLEQGLFYFHFNSSFSSHSMGCLLLNNNINKPNELHTS